MLTLLFIYLFIVFVNALNEKGVILIYFTKMILYLIFIKMIKGSHLVNDFHVLIYRTPATSLPFKDNS